MVDNDSQSRSDDKGLHGKSTRDRVFRATWIYLRGWLVILVLFLVAKAAAEAYTRVAGITEPVFESLESSAPSVITTLAILIIGPWVIGKVVELVLTGKLFQKQRGLRAVARMERRLATELKADRHQGYRVALVNWPNSDTRSLGVIVADFSEPETERELAAVYLPGTPDPTKGAIRVVATDDLTLTDWDLSDLARFHYTFGSASPELSDSDDAE